MANRKIHFVESGESSAHFLYLKNQQVKMKPASNSTFTRTTRSESKMTSQTCQSFKAIDTTVKHVGFGSYSKCMSYISFIDGVSTFSKAIELKPVIGPKGGRPRKLQNSKPSTVPKRKKMKKREPTPDSSEIKETDLPHVQATTVVTATSVAEALDVIEKRKKNIKAKLLLKRENLLTQEEEQDIHTRADIYAMTAIPDPEFYILPEDDPLPPPSLRLEDVHIVTSYPPSRKKRRRNYGTTNCYVNHHNEEDVFDNTKMLPLGTRLLKPPTKLVELVAHAIDGSPDGLLQVQQIYTYLQNKFPFFRYMERIAINSWRSSIRHALYQKWFRKIRFDLSYISSKGCYWAINHKTSPKEWTMPVGKPGHAEQADDVNLEELAIDPELHENVCALLEEEKMTDTQTQSDVIAIAREFGISPSETDEREDPMIDVIDVDLYFDTKEDHHVPSPVREPDPILATCAPDWKSEDFYLSSAESGCSSMSSSLGSPPCTQLGSPLFLPYPEEPRADQYIGIPMHSPCPKKLCIKSSSDSEPRQTDVSAQKQKMRPFSPLVTWAPNWEEYGSYILPTQSVRTLKYCNTDYQQECFDCNAELDCFSPVDMTGKEFHMYEDINLSQKQYNSDSPSSEFEVIAEYSQPTLSSQGSEVIYE